MTTDDSTIFRSDKTDDSKTAEVAASLMQAIGAPAEARTSVIWRQHSLFSTRSTGLRQGERRMTRQTEAVGTHTRCRTEPRYIGRDKGSSYPQKDRDRRIRVSGRSRESC